jgi:hypothetical protein
MGTVKARVGTAKDGNRGGGDDEDDTQLAADLEMKLMAAALATKEQNDYSYKYEKKIS